MKHEKRDKVTKTDVRKLRQAVHELADTVDKLVDEANIDGDSEIIKNKTQKIRDKTPEPVTDIEKIHPPWEREGFDSKEDWMESK
jgi:hypothetical protein